MSISNFENQYIFDLINDMIDMNYSILDIRLLIMRAIEEKLLTEAQLESLFDKVETGDVNE